MHWILTDHNLLSNAFSIYQVYFEEDDDVKFAFVNRTVSYFAFPQLQPV